VRELRLFGTAHSSGDGKPERLESWSFEPGDPPGVSATRELAIRAQGQRFTITWPGAEDYRVDKVAPKVLDRLQQPLHQQPDPPLEFGARGGLGVSVQGGSVSFRNLTLVPGGAG
jgi:hypothetical protein